MTKKQAIQNAAEILFSTKGYHATSIRNIAEYSKTNVAMVIYYFKSKENLLLEIIGKLQISIENIKEALGPLEQFADKKLYAFTCLSVSEFSRVQNVFRVFMQLQMLDVSIKTNTEIKSIRDRHLDILNNILKEALRNKNAQLPSILLYNSFLGLLNDVITETAAYDNNNNNNTQYLNSSLALELYRFLKYFTCESSPKFC